MGTWLKSILLLLLILSFKSYAQSCEEAGGISEGVRCQCHIEIDASNPQKKIVKYFSPTIVTCDMLRMSFSLSQSSPFSIGIQDPCQQLSKYLPMDAEAGVVKEGELCENPAKFICNPLLNKEHRKISEFDKSFEERRLEIMKSDKVVVDFIKKHNREASSCEDLSTAWQKENDQRSEATKRCMNMVWSRMVQAKIIKDEEGRDVSLKARAMQITEKAKKKVLAYLESKRKGAGRNSAQIRKLNQMIEKIKGTTYQYNDFDFSGGWEYSAFATHRHGTAQVFTKGMLMIAERSPEALESIMIHEFSHHIDPNKEEFPPTEENPFGRVAQCMSWGDSAYIRRRQYGEGFAEWMASEVFTLHQLNSESSMEGISGKDGERIIDLTKRPHLVSIQKAFAYDCNTYWLEREKFERKGDDRYSRHRRSYDWHAKNEKKKRPGVHVQIEDRMNGIFFANPKIKKALGCSGKTGIRQWTQHAYQKRQARKKKYSQPVMFLNEQTRRNAKYGVGGYCGDKLYQ